MKQQDMQNEQEFLNALKQEYSMDAKQRSRVLENAWKRAESGKQTAAAGKLLPSRAQSILHSEGIRRALPLAACIAVVLFGGWMLYTKLPKVNEPPIAETTTASEETTTATTASTTADMPQTVTHTTAKPSGEQSTEETTDTTETTADTVKTQTDALQESSASDTEPSSAAQTTSTTAANETIAPVSAGSAATLRTTTTAVLVTTTTTENHENRIAEDAELYMSNVSARAGQQLIVPVHFGRHVEFAGAQMFFVLRSQNDPNRMAKITGIQVEIYEDMADGSRQDVGSIETVSNENSLAACVIAESKNFVPASESVASLYVTIPEDAQEGDIYRLELRKESKYTMEDGTAYPFGTTYGDIKIIK